MNPDIKVEICKLDNLPPDHELIKQIEPVFLNLEHENPFEEQLDMILKLNEITTKAIGLYIQVVSII